MQLDYENPINAINAINISYNVSNCTINKQIVITLSKTLNAALP